LSINVVHLTIIAQIIVFAVFLYSTYFLIKESPLSPATVALIFFTSVSSLYCLVMALRQCTKGGVSRYYPGIHLPLSAKINTKRVQLAYSYWNKRYRTRAHRWNAGSIPFIFDHTGHLIWTTIWSASTTNALGPASKYDRRHTAGNPTND